MDDTKAFDVPDGMPCFLYPKQPDSINMSNKPDDLSSFTDDLLASTHQNPSNIGGRPKGSTCGAKEVYYNVVKKAITDASVLFQQEITKAER
jgi:hypothetical protein